MLSELPISACDALREYAGTRGLKIAGEYVDHGVSGAKVRRPGLDRMMADAGRRRFDVVACVKLDRLARSVAHLTSMAQDFEALGIDLVVLDQAIDTSTSTGKLLFHVLGAIAEFERSLIQERTRAGLAAARRRGQKLGRPRVPDARQKRRIQRLAASGHSLREISERVGVSKSTVARTLAAHRTQAA